MTKGFVITLSIAAMLAVMLVFLLDVSFYVHTPFMRWVLETGAGLCALSLMGMIAFVSKQ